MEAVPHAMFTSTLNLMGHQRLAALCGVHLSSVYRWASKPAAWRGANSLYHAIVRSYLEADPGMRSIMLSGTLEYGAEWWIACAEMTITALSTFNRRTN